MANKPFYCRLAFSVLCGIAAVLLFTLWIRSQWTYDGVFSRYFMATSEYGRLMVHVSTVPKSTSFEYLSGPLTRIAQFRPEERTLFGFNAFGNRSSLTVIVPDWFAINCAGLLAAAPWIRWPNRLSQRTQLVAIVLVTILLGLGLWASRR